MASSGPNYAGTGADDAAYGEITWSNPGNITANDGTNASATAVGSQNSHWLKATNFGFSIPAGATIDGIVVEWEASKSGTQFVYDLFVRIVKGGTIGSTDKAAYSALTTTPTVYSFGSSSYLWGETWSYSDINSSTFGAAIVYGVFSSDTCLVDFCRITVYYTESAAGQPAIRRHGLAQTQIWQPQGAEGLRYF